MKKLFVLVACVFVTACGTIGGAMQGASQDLNTAGAYVKNIGKDSR
jgi:predicted small secreted protein